MFALHEFIELARSSPISFWCDQPPWLITTNAQQIVEDMLKKMSGDFERRGSVTVHKTATIDSAAVIKGPEYHCCPMLYRGGVLRARRCLVG
jgi:hypothetical protein